MPSRPTGPSPVPTPAGPPECPLRCPAHSPGRGRILPRPTALRWPCWSPAQPRRRERAASVRCFGLNKKKKRKKSGISQQKRNKTQFCLPQSVTEGGLSIRWRKQKGSCTARISQTIAWGVIYRWSCTMINQALFWLLINLPL